MRVVNDDGGGRTLDDGLMSRISFSRNSPTTKLARVWYIDTDTNRLLRCRDRNGTFSVETTAWERDGTSKP